MAEKQKGGGVGLTRLPPGFRFHPTDEELLEQYLKRKVCSSPFPALIIPEIELNKFDPWDLPGGAHRSNSKAEVRKVYFFNRREAKYRNGMRSNRAGASGYWKATGKDRVIMASKGDQVIGKKKVLVFYRGRPPLGSRTDWVMHEYHLVPEAMANPPLQMQLCSSQVRSLFLHPWKLDVANILIANKSPYL